MTIKSLKLAQENPTRGNLVCVIPEDTVRHDRLVRASILKRDDIPTRISRVLTFIKEWPPTSASNGSRNADLCSESHTAGGFPAKS